MRRARARRGVAAAPGGWRQLLAAGALGVLAGVLAATCASAAPRDDSTPDKAKPRGRSAGGLSASRPR